MKKCWHVILKYLAITLGCALYAASFNLFLRPYDIVPGGVSGIAMILNTLFGKPSVGVLILLINIPLCVLAWVLLGRKFILDTLYGMVVSSLLIDLFAVLPAIETESILAALYGGLFNGAGLGLVYYTGGTTGGVDIVASLVRRKWPAFKMGRIMLVIDAAVVISAAVVFRSVAGAMYAIVVFYIASLVTDAILYGGQNARIAYIISEKQREISAAILREIDRGVTLLHGSGAYTGEMREVILCAVKRRQVTQLKRLVREIDVNAFLIITNANEVLGNGFST